MRVTRYGEPSDSEIDALRIPPTCECGNPIENYDDTCEACLDDPDQDGRDEAFIRATQDLFK
jgi:hypothetical protein